MVPAGRSFHERSHSRVAPYPARREGAVTTERRSSSQQPPSPQQSSCSASPRQPLPRPASPQDQPLPRPASPQEQSLSRPASPQQPQIPAAMGQSTPIPASTEGSGTDLDLYQLLIQPIVKETLGQRDTSGNTLDSTVVSGGSFGEIMGKLWDRYASRVKSRGVKTDGVWSAEQPVAAEWSNVMQFKLRKHVVDSTKSEHAWNQWLVKMRGQTVLFLIFEFGTGISRAQDLVAFKAACIQPEHTDRAGATADVSLRDVISRLQANWGTTFQGPAAVWRMWGNHITRNLNRSTWERDIEELPPRYIAALLRLTDSPLEQRVVNISQSTNIALDCVRAALGDVRQVRRDNEAVARRLEELERNLEGREDILLSIQANISPPSPSSVPDPMDRLRNTEDIDHTD